ncbi:hypothetical protein MCCC1A01412_14805 [Bacillus anthracis]|nr:hypothetical protein MCCC1A01412_14805 [Bacillus anthracis]
MLRTYRMFHGGNGTTPVDSGLPLQGIFYSLKGRDGSLEWNKYLGQGEPWWHPANEHNWDFNTGNQIGRDFGHMLHVFGCGDGDIMAIHPNGNLHWYSYNGKGELDVNGTLGWHQNSGNVIGNGWQKFIRIFVRPYSGRSSTARLEIFAVEQNGDLRWYSYSGIGENDPSGTLGWHPNSGNRIGNGWQNFRNIHGSGRAIFGIHENGELYWYSYSGNGEDDLSGTLGWHPNSGNVIDRGSWKDMKYAFGGVTTLGGIGHVIMAVDQDDNLFWFKYTGEGERPERDWDFRSGTRIGRSSFTRAIHSVVVHFKTLVSLSSERINWINEQFQAMHDLFAQGGIAVYQGTTEDLSNNPNLQQLKDIHVGECRRNEQPSQEIIELFNNRNYVGPNELVIYLVDNITTDSSGFPSGCAVYPNGKPGAVVNCNFSPNGTGDSKRFAWLVAHEVAHVLGLNHSPNQDNLMYEGLRFTILPPQLTYSDFNILHGSEFCHQCRTVVGAKSPPSCC